MSVSSIPPSVIPISSRPCPVTTRSPSSIRGPSSVPRSVRPISRRSSRPSMGESTRKCLKRYDLEAVLLALAELVELDLLNDSPEDDE
mgnify:CR=1 FL=1